MSQTWDKVGYFNVIKNNPFQLDGGNAFLFINPEKHQAILVHRKNMVMKTR